MSDDPIDLIEDLESLSMLTGINLKHLRQMRDGDILPDHAHVRVLGKYLSPEQVDLFRTHDIPVLEEERFSRPGQAPEGCSIHVAVQASQILPGDYLAYWNPYDRQGEHWVKVESVEKDNIHWVIGLKDSEGEMRYMYTSATRPIRVARPGHLPPLTSANGSESDDDVEVI